MLGYNFISKGGSFSAFEGIPVKMIGWQSPCRIRVDHRQCYLKEHYIKSNSLLLVIWRDSLKHACESCESREFHITASIFVEGFQKKNKMKCNFRDVVIFYDVGFILSMSSLYHVSISTKLYIYLIWVIYCKSLTCILGRIPWGDQPVGLCRYKLGRQWALSRRLFHLRLVLMKEFFLEGQEEAM